MYIPCKVCDRGSLAAKKIFRLSGPVVFIGYVLLIPSICGILISALMLLVVAISSVAHPYIVSNARNQAIANMQRVNVPERTIGAVLERRDDLLEPQLGSDSLSDIQKRWVRDSREKLKGSNENTVFGVVVGGSFSVLLGIASMVGGLLGWLLVMKKRVLQCNLCSAVVNAS